MLLKLIGKIRKPAPEYLESVALGNEAWRRENARLAARLAAQEQARIRRRAQAREIARRHNKEGAR